MSVDGAVRSVLHVNSRRGGTPWKPASRWAPPWADNHAQDVAPQKGSCTDLLPEGVLARAWATHAVTGEEVVIAELVDADGDGTPGAGDVVHAGHYPLDFDGTSFATFTVDEVEAIDGDWHNTSSIWVHFIAPDGSTTQIDWLDQSRREFLTITPQYSDLGNAIFRDYREDMGFPDSIGVADTNPFGPTQSSYQQQPFGGDDPFLQVQVVGQLP